MRRLSLQGAIWGGLGAEVLVLGLKDTERCCSFSKMAGPQGPCGNIAIMTGLWLLRIIWWMVA